MRQARWCSGHGTHLTSERPKFEFRLRQEFQKKSTPLVQRCNNVGRHSCKRKGERDKTTNTSIFIVPSTFFRAVDPKKRVLTSYSKARNETRD